MVVCFFKQGIAVNCIHQNVVRSSEILVNVMLVNYLLYYQLNPILFLFCIFAPNLTSSQFKL